MEKLKAHEALDFCDRIKREKNVIFYIFLSFYGFILPRRLSDEQREQARQRMKKINQQ